MTVFLPAYVTHIVVDSVDNNNDNKCQTISKGLWACFRDRVWWKTFMIPQHLCLMERGGCQRSKAGKGQSVQGEQRTEAQGREINQEAMKTAQWRSYRGWRCSGGRIERKARLKRCLRAVEPWDEGKGGRILLRGQGGQWLSTETGNTWGSAFCRKINLTLGQAGSLSTRP